MFSSCDVMRFDSYSLSSLSAAKGPVSS